MNITPNVADSGYIPDPTFRQLTQEVLDIWNDPNPDRTLGRALQTLLNELTGQIFADGPFAERPISAAIAIHDEKRNRFRVEQAAGPMANDMLHHQPRNVGLTAHVYKSRAPLIVPHLSHWPLNVPTPRLGMMQERSVQSIALFPLLFGQDHEEEAIGVLTITSTEPLQDDSRWIVATQVFADKLAFMIQTARVHRRRLREEAALGTISQVAAEGELDTVAKVIARQAVTLTRAVYAVVFSSSGPRGWLNSMGLSEEQGILTRGSRIKLDLKENSINSHVYKTMRPYYAQDLSEDPFFYNYGSWDEGTASAYCVPLRVDNDTLVGTLYVASSVRNGFSSHDRNFINKLAFHAASALRSTGLLNNVVRFQLAISDILPVGEQFTQIRKEFERIGLDTSGLFISVYNQETDTISFPKVCHHNRLIPDDDPLRTTGQLYATRQLGERGGLVDWVIQTQSSLLVPNFSLWSSLQQFQLDEYEDLHCALVVPMYSHGKIVGALGLRGYDRPDLFNEYDQQFLTVAANHVAIAIENADRYSMEVRQRDFQSKVSELHEKIADTLPIPQQMTQIRVELQRLGIDTSGIFIATFDEATQMIDLPKVYDMGVPISEREKEFNAKYGPRRLGKRMGLIDWCILNHPRPLLIPDFEKWTHRDEIDAEYAQHIQCVLMCPMYIENDLIGIIGLRGYEKSHMYDSSHEELMAEIANFMAIVVKNAQLLDAAQRKVEHSNKQLKRQLSLWQSLSKFQREISDIGSSEKEISDIWRHTQSALREVGVDPGNLYLALHSEGKIIFYKVFEEGQPVSDDSLDRPGRPYMDRMLGERPDLTEWIITHGETLHFRSRREMEQFKVLKEDLQFIPQFSHSWIGVPLKKGERVFGMMALRSFEANDAFDDLLREFMENIAGQAAIVLDNARHLDASLAQSHYNRALAQAGRSIASAGLEIDRVLHTILRQAVEVTGARFGTFQLVQDGFLEISAIWPTEIESIVRERIGRIPIDGPGIATKAFREGDAQLVHNVSQDPDYIPIVDGIHSELAVVLRGVGQRKGDVIGVINVEHESPYGLTSADRSLLVQLSRSAAVAIDYAEQYQALEKARDIGLASTAIAWLGLFGADWQHTINQKTFSISNYVSALRRYLQKVENTSTTEGVKFNGTLPLLHEGLDNIKKVTDEIRDVEFTQQVQLPPSISETFIIGDQTQKATPTASGFSLIDAELEQMVDLWCRNHDHIAVDYALQCMDTKVGIAPQWLKVAIEKIVNNALKVMPESGNLSVATQQSNRGVEITISDTGPGIPEQIREYFLKRVVPRHVNAGGSGMGIMIARFVALSHGGDLTWRSRVDGSGTELIMTLPLQNSESEKQEDKSGE